MNVLVTGGAGYIGSVTAAKLIKGGHSVVIYDNLSTGFREALPEQAKFIFGDVRDQALLARVMADQKIEAVVHFAAKLIVPESVEKPWDYYDNNVGGVLSTVQACLKSGVDKVVFSSTAAVYGNPERVPVEESSPTNPLSPYGASKLMAENILRDVGQASSLRSVILRYFNVAGASEDGMNGQRMKNATHLVKISAEAAAGQRESITMTGTDFPTPDGTGVRDYIHVEDLADAHVLALEYLARGGASETLNCAYGQGSSVRQVVETMRAVSGVNFAALEGPRRAGDPASITASGERLRKKFDWKPKFADLREICRSAYQWELTMKKGGRT